MIKFRLLIARLTGHDRRTHVEPVATERRQDRPQKRPGFKESAERAHNALEDFEKTVRLTRTDFKPPERTFANDSQEVVIFSTLQDACRFRGSPDLTVRLCRNAKHEAANTGLAICNEEQCPILLEAIAGAAA